MGCLKLSYCNEDKALGTFRKNLKVVKGKSGFSEKNGLNYSTFGSLMPNRHASSGDYRYGFGGHEKDDEVKGITGSHYAFGDYGYDPRLGKRWNIDPKIKEFPHVSPYSTFFGNPIKYSDPTGENPFLIGALIGAATDALIQGIEISLDDKKTFSKDFSFGSVGVSAAAGLTGVGLATKLGKAKTLIKIATSVTTDAAASVATSVVKGEEVNATDVAIDVTVGQGVGKFVGDLVDVKFLKTKTGKQLTEQVNQQKNASKGQSNTISKAKSNVKGATQKLTNAQKSRSAGASAAAAQSGSTAVKGIKNQVNESDEKK